MRGQHVLVGLGQAALAVKRSFNINISSDSKLVHNAVSHSGGIRSSDLGRVEESRHVRGESDVNSPLNGVYQSGGVSQFMHNALFEDTTWRENDGGVPDIDMLDFDDLQNSFEDYTNFEVEPHPFVKEVEHSAAERSRVNPGSGDINTMRAEPQHSIAPSSDANDVLQHASFPLNVIDLLLASGGSESGGVKVLIVVSNLPKELLHNGIWCHFGNARSLCVPIADGVLRCAVPKMSVMDSSGRSLLSNSINVGLYLSSGDYQSPCQLNFLYTSESTAHNSSEQRTPVESSTLNGQKRERDATSSAQSCFVPGEPRKIQVASPDESPLRISSVPSPFSRVSTSLSTSSSSSLEHTISSQKPFHQHKEINGSLKRPRSPKHSVQSRNTGIPTPSASNECQPQYAPYSLDISDRQLKIRVVERLTALVKAPGKGDFTASSSGEALQNLNAPTQDSSRSSSHETGNGVHADTGTDDQVALLSIDDAELNGCSDDDLNQMSIQAAKQLVQALTRMADANENDGLREELWNLDSNGFSLLHYICMYGYKSLTPVVLECIKRG